MKKAIISRALMGFPAGIAIGQCISLLVSAILGQGTFEACMPSFVAAMGSELAAVALQTLLCGVLGLPAPLPPWCGRRTGACSSGPSSASCC